MSKNSSFNRLCFAVLLAFTGSCSSHFRAEPYELPEEALETALEDSANGPVTQVSQSMPADWWILFNDEQLAEFIMTAFANNPSLQAAQAKIYQAAYRADLARAPLFPNVNWGGDVSREKFSETGLIPFSPTGPTVGSAPLAAQGGASGIPVYFTQYETELLLKYDFDVWGKNRNTLRAAIGEVRANIADEAFSRLQLGIAVASVYYQLQVDYLRRDINKALVESQEKSLKLQGLRQGGNLANHQAVLSNQTYLSSANQVLLQILGDIAVKEHQLKAYLAGNFDEKILNINITEMPLPKVPLPKDLPVHLLAYRPDITAQLWLIESAGRLIEVAKAGFYPDFNLTAIFGFQTLHLSKLFTYPSTYYNVDPAFTLPVFDGGRLIANLRGSEINYDLAILQYNEMVINAVKEVLDGIAVLQNSYDQFQEFKNKLDQQEQTFNLTKLQVQNNLSSGIDYLSSEQNMLTAKDQEVVSLGLTIQAALSLIKAVGGGYDACY